MDMISAFTLNLRLIKPDMSVKVQIIVRIGQHKKRKDETDFSSMIQITIVGVWS